VKELPEGWEWRTVGEISERIHYGYTASAENKKTGPRLLRITDIQNNNVNWATVPSCQIAEKDLPNYLLKSGDLVFARTGATVGKSFLIEGNIPESVFASYLIRVILKKNVNQKFIYYFFQSPHYWNQIEKQKVGAGQENVNSRKLSQIEIPLPPLPIQNQIVAVLEQAEAVSRRRKDADALTGALLQSVFWEMFGDPVTNERGWKLEKLENLCLKHFGGGTPSKSKPEYYTGNIPWVSPKDMKVDFIWDSMDHISEEAIENSATQKAPIGSLLMVIRSAILKKNLPVAATKVEVTINQDMKAFVFNEKKTNSYFMLFFFKAYQRALLSKVRAVTADNIEFNLIKSAEVIMPPLALQLQFAHIVERVERIRDQHAASGKEIEGLCEGLMQRAFAGELLT